MPHPASPRSIRPGFALILAVVAPLLTSAVWRQSTPAITSLSATTLARSGRLVLSGTGFGDAQGTGRVTIAGQRAIVTRWSDTRITAYVPEVSPLGPAAVSVTTDAGTSNDLLLDITARALSGRVQWRFQVDSDYVAQRPAVGLDGTIVAHDSSGFVYALAPDGGLKWVFRAGGPSGPPVIGPDGSVFVACDNRVYGLAPDGALRWLFDDPDSQGTIAGPSLGPDGNLYLVNDMFGLGALSLSPAGALLWSHPGNPQFTEYGQIGAEIVFGPSAGPGSPDRLFFGLDEYSVAAPTVFGLGLDGQQAWAREAGGSSDPFMQQQQQIATAPGGTVYVTSMSSASGWGLKAIDPSNGAFLWGYNPWPANGMSPPDVGSNGVIYLARSLDYLDAVSPAGKLLWTFFDGTIVDPPIVNRGATLVVAGGKANFGEPGYVRGYAATNGTIRWTVPLGVENGGNIVTIDRPRFSLDDRTVYVGTAILGGNASDPYAYLYAIKASDAVAAPGEAGTAGPMTVRGGAGSSVVVDFTPACNAVDHAVYWGTLAGGAFHWSGSACGFGSGSTATIDPGTPAVGSAFFFVVAGRNAAGEGSYGRSSAGVERPEASGMGACERPQVLATSCAP